MQPLEIKKDIYVLETIDWNLRDFHGFVTENGSTYNTYLLKDEKNVLFDTVKAEFALPFIEDVKSLIGNGKIDYLVVNHAEMDHSGSLPAVMEHFKPEKLICTKACQDALVAHFHKSDWPFMVVKEGDTLSVGNRTIQFIGSPMIHWPESMVSYIKEEKLLISNDIFGQHWATSERFDDLVDQGELFYQSRKYYANIFLPMSPAIRKFIEKLGKLGVAPDMIAPDHGVIWRRDIAAIMKAYTSWANGETKPKAVIIYDTMWESTAKMATAVGRGLSGAGVSVKVYDLRFTPPSDIVAEILDARAIILGSSLLNSNILPRMEMMLSYMGGLRPTNKIGAAFGSYGWSNMPVKILTQKMEEMKFQIVDPGISVQYVPTPDVLKQCLELGIRIGETIINK